MESLILLPTIKFPAKLNNSKMLHVQKLFEYKMSWFMLISNLYIFSKLLSIPSQLEHYSNKLENPKARKLWIFQIHSIVTCECFLNHLHNPKTKNISLRN